MTEELRGVVKAVIFKSKDESYCVFRIEEKGSGTSVTVTGNIVIPYVGENVVVRGGLVEAPPFWFAVQGFHFGEDETGSGR